LALSSQYVQHGQRAVSRVHTHATRIVERRTHIVGSLSQSRRVVYRVVEGIWADPRGISTILRVGRELLGDTDGPTDVATARLAWLRRRRAVGTVAKTVRVESMARGGSGNTVTRDPSPVARGRRGKQTWVVPTPRSAARSVAAAETRASTSSNPVVMASVTTRRLRCVSIGATTILCASTPTDITPIMTGLLRCLSIGTASKSCSFTTPKITSATITRI